MCLINFLLGGAGLGFGITAFVMTLKSNKRLGIVISRFETYIKDPSVPLPPIDAPSDNNYLKAAK